MKKGIIVLICLTIGLTACAAGAEKGVSGTLESGPEIFTFSLIGDCCIADHAQHLGAKSGYTYKIKKAANPLAISKKTAPRNVPQFDIY